jgi:hypothetical protein
MWAITIADLMISERGDAEVDVAEVPALKHRPLVNATADGIDNASVAYVECSGLLPQAP